MTDPACAAIRSVTTRAVRVPLRFTLGTSADLVTAVPLLLVDLATTDGITGQAYLFCYTASGARAVGDHLREAVELVAGRPATPVEIGRTLGKRFTLLGATGTVRMALSALDMALWDARAQALGQPLAALLGGIPRPLPAYDSRGLGLMPPARLADEAEQLLEKGLRALKIRLGYPTLAEDLAAVDAVHRRAPAGTALMGDYNQALTPAEAVRRGRALDACGLEWIEDPVAHDDLQSYAALARELRTPVQFGENLNGPDALMRAVAAAAGAYAMPDVTRIGGVTGWMQAAGVAAAAGLPLSSHLLPEISAQLLCVTPTAHWLEYVDWADGFLTEPLRVVDGCVVTSERPGTGVRFDEDRVKRLDAL